jgi:hypothetical protein
MNALNLRIESAEDQDKWIHSKSNESIGDEQGHIL